MKGKYHITVANEMVKYDFDIRRNITIIKGDSAPGKTTLVEMIREFYEDGVCLEADPEKAFCTVLFTEVLFIRSVVSSDYLLF